MSTGDVLLFMTPNGIDVNVINGNLEEAQSIETYCLLSFFGGNTNGSDWWGNSFEQDAQRLYRSETHSILESLPPGSASLQKLERAVKADLSGLALVGATLDNVMITIPEQGRVQILVNITIESRDYSINIATEWKK